MHQQFDFGCPKNFGDSHFGLYQPVLDCILLTVCDLAHAQETKMLASARYSLYVVNLTAARNYLPNLIDNSCCENWTLSNKDMIAVANANKINIVNSEWLIETNTADPDVAKEKSYLQKVLHNVQYCLNIRTAANKHIHDWIDTVSTLDFADQDYTMINECIKKIKQSLWLGVDLDQIEAEIEPLKSQIKKLY